MPGARGSLLRGLLLLAHHSRSRQRPLLLRFIAVPVFLHRRRRFPDVVDRKKSSTAGLHLSSAKRSPTRHFCFPLFVASLTLAQSLACWSFHLEQCLNKWSLVC